VSLVATCKLCKFIERNSRITLTSLICQKNLTICSPASEPSSALPDKRCRRLRDKREENDCEAPEPSQDCGNI
jgi:hypothetical protein